MDGGILAEEGVEGFGATSQILRPANDAMRAVTRLHRVDGRLAVYGVMEAPTAGATPAQADRQLSFWHVVKPGTYVVPQIAAHAGFGSWGLSHARALCGRAIVTNGHAADHTPPERDLCPACSERL